MDDQMTIFDYCKQMRTPEYYEHKCEFCYWGSDESTCQWSTLSGRQHISYFACVDHSKWQPSISDIPRLCGNCKHCNQFEYQTKPEYEEEERRHNGYSRRAADDPLEEPNIYCTRPGGSVNRTRPYLKYCEHGFGVGHWHRQHEWDTCDGWELDREWYGKMYEKLKEEE